MTYKKAEIRVLGDAVTVIQSLQKVPQFAFDTRDQVFEIPSTDAAYDLDD